jgi:hypothetical protein
MGQGGAGAAVYALGRGGLQLPVCDQPLRRRNEVGEQLVKVVRTNEFIAAERWVVQLDDQNLVAALSNKEVVSQVEMSLRPTTSCFCHQNV